METQPLRPTLSAAAIAALQQGNKIEAIKIVRTEQSLDLKQAKDLVDEYLRTQPALQETFATTQTQLKRSALLWLVLLIGGAILLYLFLAKR